ncbi:hypothetical protein JCM11641_003379 [Rhodosporidiobolus odoratus]
MHAFFYATSVNHQQSAIEKQRAFTLSNLNNSEYTPSARVMKEVTKAVGEEIALFNPLIYSASSGKKYWMISPLDVIRGDFGIANLRRQLHLYPEQQSSISSSIQSQKFYNLPSHLRPPMIVQAGRHWYINELSMVQLSGDSTALVWVDRDLLSNGPEVHRKLQVSGITLVDDVNGSCTCVNNGEDGMLRFENPDRLLAGGKCFYTIPMNLGLDDFSGARTKRWNKHLMVTIQNSALPAHLRASRRHVHLVAASRHASPHDLVEGVVHELNATIQSPALVFDVKTNTTVLVKAILLFSGHDGPMGAELCSRSIAPSANYACRRCRFGGTKKEKAEAMSILALTQPGNPLTPAYTRAILSDLETLATSLSPKSAIASLTSTTGVKDVNISARLEAINLKAMELRSTAPDGTEPDHFHPLLKAYEKAASKKSQDSVRKTIEEQIKDELRDFLSEMKDTTAGESSLFDAAGFDPHQDTVQDVLHVVLLGLVKYYWVRTVSASKELKQILHNLFRLSSFSAISDELPQASLYVDKPNGLTGKDYRYIVQIMPSFLPDLLADSDISGDLAECWSSLARLTALLYVPMILDMEPYMERLKNCLKDFYLAALRYDPALVLAKNKFHAVSHFLDDIPRFGPPNSFSNEPLESFNSPVRETIAHTNRQFPSRDISLAFATYEQATFLAEGGIWIGENGQRSQAGPGVQRLQRSSDLARLRGEMFIPEGDEGRNAITTAEGLATTLAAKTASRDSLITQLFPLDAQSGRPSIVRIAKTIRTHCGDRHDKLGMVEEILAFTETRFVTQFIVTVRLYTAQPVDSQSQHGTILRVERTEKLVNVLDQDIAAPLFFAHDCGTHNREIPNASQPPAPEGKKTILPPHHTNPLSPLLINLATHRNYWLIDVLRPPVALSVFGTMHADAAAEALAERVVSKGTKGKKGKQKIVTHSAGQEGARTTARSKRKRAEGSLWDEDDDPEEEEIGFADGADSEEEDEDAAFDDLFSFLQARTSVETDAAAAYRALQAGVTTEEDGSRRSGQVRKPTAHVREAIESSRMEGEAYWQQRRRKEPTGGPSTSLVAKNM